MAVDCTVCHASVPCVAAPVVHIVDHCIVFIVCYEGREICDVGWLYVTNIGNDTHFLAEKTK